MKAEKDMQGKELLERRFKGTITLTFEDVSTGMMVARAVKMDAVWDDRELMTSCITGLGEQLVEAVEMRVEEVDGVYKRGMPSRPFSKNIRET